jgi:hypothetical protein
VTVVVIMLRVEVRVKKFVEMRDGLTRMNGQVEIHSARDVPHEQQMPALRFGNEGWILIFRNGIVDFDGIVSGVGLVIYKANGFVSSMRASEKRADGENTWAEEFSICHLLSPPEMSGASIEIEDGGHAIGEIERKFDGRVEVDMSIGEAGDQIFASGVDCVGGFGNLD